MMKEDCLKGWRMVEGAEMMWARNDRGQFEPVTDCDGGRRGLEQVAQKTTSAGLANHHVVVYYSLYSSRSVTPSFHQPFPSYHHKHSQDGPSSS